jgi:hypothetical protein
MTRRSALGINVFLAVLLGLGFLGPSDYRGESESPENVENQPTERREIAVIRCLDACLRAFLGDGANTIMCC